VERYYARFNIDWMCAITNIAVMIGIHLPRGRCYDHNFRRFLSNFWRKNGVFLKNRCYDYNFALFSFVLSQKRQFLFRRKYLKNHNIGPRQLRFQSELIKKFVFLCRQYFPNQLPHGLEQRVGQTWLFILWQ
jgi:hypothetical protein